MIQLPGYELSALLHESRRTLVYRGMRIDDECPVIIKLPASPIPSLEEQKRFEHEFEIGSRFKESQYVAHYQQLLPYSGGHAIVIEDIDATDLERQIPSDGFPTMSFLDMAIDLAEGLNDIHQAEIVHKDIKPTNLLMCPSTLQVKYIDFGIASELEREYQLAEAPEKLEGTVAYISPEQTGRMNRAIDFRTDFYSLGITYYHMLTGHLPFQGADALEIIHAHIAKPPADPCSHRPETPKALSQIILKLLSKGAEKRYQSCKGLSSDLKHVRDALQKKESLDDFEPGIGDVSEQFVLSQRLYGRDEEWDTLAEAYEDIQQGATRFIFMAGQAGIGKSSLIRELRKSMGPQTFFLSARFEGLNRHVAYGTITEAFSSLIQRILSEDDQTIQSWRAALMDAMGPNARLVMDIMPDLAMLLGPLPEIPDVEPQEQRNRFYQAVEACLRVLASERHPLVLFLDDLQYSDTASLNLIEHLISDQVIPNFLFIGSYRKDEVDEQHPLQVMFNTIEPREGELSHLSPKPLQTEHIAQLLMDSFGIDHDRALPLAALVHAKTNGIPFFCNEWLRSLHHKGLLIFNPQEGGWYWDEPAISELEVSSNVVEFLIDNLKVLPEETRGLLSIASCVGNQFDLDILEHIQDFPTEKLSKILWPALRWGLLVPLNTDYSQQANSEPETANQLHAIIRYRFQHERIRLAAYSLIEEDKRKRLHLRIGRYHRQNLSSAQSAEIMEVLSHINKALDLISDPSELLTLARLNCEAGRRALHAVAYASASEFLNQATFCLPPNHWHEHYELSFEIYLLRAQSTYYRADIKDAAEECRQLMTQANNPIDKARVYEIIIAQHTILGQFKQAIIVGLEGLRAFGMDIPERPKTYQVAAALLRIRGLLAKKELNRLHLEDDLREEWVRFAIKLLTRITFCAYLIGRQKLFALTTTLSVELTLRYGNTPEAALTYTYFGVLMGHGLNRPKDAYQIGKLALRLQDRYRDPTMNPKVVFIYAFLIHSWNHHWKSISPYLRQVVESGQQAGDFMVAAIASAMVYRWDPTLNLSQSYEQSLPYLTMIKEFGYGDLEIQAQIFQQVRANLMGKTKGPLSLSDDTFDESKLKLPEMRNTTLSTVYNVTKLELAFLNGLYDKADTFRKQTKANLRGIIGIPGMVEYVFYAALTIMAQAKANPTRMNILQAIIRVHPLIAKMARWSKHCPVNFHHRFLLLRAEAVGLLGWEGRALNLYIKSVEIAGENGYLCHQGLASELAGQYLIWRGRPRLGAVYLRDALEYYGRWGAMGLVNGLRQRHADLLPTIKDRKRTANTSTGSAPTSAHSLDQGETNLDFSSVVKSSIAISSEIEYRSLIAKMMDIIIENAGARKAALIRQHKGNLRVEAIAHLDAPDHEVIRAQPLENCQDLPVKLIRYTYRKGQVMSIADVHVDANFKRDPYVVENQIKSVLTMPIRHKDQTLGVVYLENNLMEGAFTSARVRVLQLLVAQAAISLENARLLSESRKTEREVRKLNRELATLNEQLEIKVLERTSQLKSAQQELLDSAHQAGMAEIATSVLHNVGNILNSVITSCQLIHSTAENTRVAGLLQANKMLSENMDDLETFVKEGKGKQLMQYYLSLDKPFTKDQATLVENALRLIDKVESIRAVIMSQQSYASKGYQSEDLAPKDVIEDALTLLATSITRHRVTIEKHYGTVPNLKLPRAKLVHVFVNLIKNAVEAMGEIDPAERKLYISLITEGETIRALFRDQGEGIDKENLENVFQHGYTTKKRGHGFGLHSVANSMTEMGGSITVDSPGKGQGAVFTLTFPLIAKPSDREDPPL